jgi:hypothetical protein
MLQTLLSIRRSPRLPSSAFLSRTVRRRATTLQSQRSTWGDNVPLGKPNFKNVQSKAAETLTGHACRHFATRKRLKFHEPYPKSDLLANHIQREDWTRMVYITSIPKFAIEEDIAGLFKESNFEVYVHHTFHRSAWTTATILSLTMFVAIVSLWPMIR